MFDEHNICAGSKRFLGEINNDDGYGSMADELDLGRGGGEMLAGGFAHGPIKRVPFALLGFWMGGC